MAQDSSAKTQTPFGDAVVPVPDATSGDQGIGGGFDMGGGESGLRQSPFDKAVVPTPSGTDESGPFGNPSRFSSIDGSTHKGETFTDDITSPPTNTITKR